MMQANHPHARAPQEIFSHRAEFEEQSWREYTLEQLGQWVSLLVMRSTHRTQPAKKAKDLYDANNYALMMLAHIDAHAADMGEGVPEREERPSDVAALERFL